MGGETTKIFKLKYYLSREMVLSASVSVLHFEQ
jgi:hypothetical protein